MLLSHSHRFLFIHVVKTGGVSIREALGRFAHLPDRALWRRAGRRLGLPLHHPLASVEAHATAADLRVVLPAQTFERYFKFAFVRNPWDWNVSFYHYVRQTPEHPLYKDASRVRDFGEFLTWRAEYARLLQKDFVAGPNGDLLVDFVGRFEDLEEDFGKVCSAIGANADLPHLNQSRHGDYRLHYTERTRRLVEEAWAEDIRFFDYQFDPATRRRAEFDRRPALRPVLVPPVPSAA